MLAKTVIAVSFAAAAVAVAPISSKQCATAKQNCCQTVQQASNPNTNLLLGLLGIVADVQGLVGVNCSPITAIGTGSGCAQSQTPVCCNKNDYNGLVNLGCSPLSIAI